MPINEPLKEAVNKAIEKGWTIRKIAEVSGVPNPSISRWLKGERGLTADTAELLCRFFSCKLSSPKIPKPPE